MLNKNKPKKDLFDVLSSFATVTQTLLGWVLAVLLLCTGIVQVLTENLIRGVAMVGLAVFICPRTPLQENWRLLIVAVIGFVVLFLMN